MNRCCCMSVVASILALLLCAGCQSSANNDAARLAVDPPASVADQAAQAALGQLPRPSQLPPAVPREASAYTEADLIRHGDEFASVLPNDLVFGVLGENKATFDPDWSPSPGGLSGLAYCCYDFSVPGYDREARLCYGWSVPPQNSDDCYIGLADWQSDMWRWFKAGTTGQVQLPNLASYIDPAGRVVVVVALMGTALARLDYLRLGAVSVVAALSVSPASGGYVPFLATGSPNGTVIGVGTARSYDWDWDGDGSPEYSYPDGQSSTFNFAAPGSGLVTLRVTNDYGESDTAAVELVRRSPWAHSWGGALAEHARAIAVDSAAQAIYVAGNTKSFSAGQDDDLLLLKYDFDGEFKWARTWGGADSELGRGIALASNDGVVVCGMTGSLGAGKTDMLVQHWDSDGMLQWTRTWGGTEFDTAFAVRVFGSAIYVAGDYGNSVFDSDGALVKLDDGGGLVWAKKIGKDESDSLRALTVRRVLPSDDERVYVTGITKSYNSDNRWEIVYAVFDETGVMQSERTFGKPGAELFASGISLSTELIGADTYICGTLNEGADYFPLLLRYGTSGWDLRGPGGGQPYPALAFSADKVYLAGRRYVGDSPQGFLARFSTDGVLEGCATWTRGADATTADNLALISGGGIVLAGSCVASEGGGWSLATMSYSDSGGSWEDQTMIYWPAEASFGLPDEPAQHISAAVLDTGGGDEDALIVARQPF